MQTRMFYRILQGDEMISAKMLKDIHLRQLQKPNTLVFYSGHAGVANNRPVQKDI